MTPLLLIALILAQQPGQSDIPACVSGDWRSAIAGPLYDDGNMPTKIATAASAYYYPTSACALPTAAELDGGWYCMNGDGGTPVGSLAFATTGTVTPFNAVICPSGTGCAPITTVESLTGVSNYMATSAVTNGTRDFTIAALIHSSETANGKAFIEKDGFTGAETLDGYSITISTAGIGAHLVFRVRTNTGTFEVSYDRNFVVGAWFWVVGVYRSIANGTSTLDLYVNGRAAPGRVTNAGATRNINTGPHYIFRGGWAGVPGAADTRYGGGFYTETAITSAARQTQLYVQAMGRNQSYVTRNSPKFCAGTEYGNFVDINEPCGSAESAATNVLEDGRGVTQNWSFGGSSDVATGLRAVDMTHTATTAHFNAVPGPAYTGQGNRQQPFVCNGIRCSCSLYVRSPDGGTGTLRLAAGVGLADGGIDVKTSCSVGPTFSRCSVEWLGASASTGACFVGRSLYDDMPQVASDVVLSLAQLERTPVSSVISTGAGVGNTPKTRAAETP